MSRITPVGLLAAALLLLMSATGPVGAAEAVSDAPLCSELGSCNTWDPDVTCYSGGIQWQFACTEGMEWCDGM